MPTTGNDLINLNTLTLTDTFQTWVNRTNQIVDHINPLQIYDLDVGTVGTFYQTGAGLAKYIGIEGGLYNGVITIGINAGPGVAYETIDGQSRTIVDFRYYDDYGRILNGTGVSSGPNRVASSDEFIVNDISDTTSSAAGTAKKVQARHMLPPEIAMPALTISGDLIVLGNFTTLGGDDFIAANNLRIEDKQLELAYQQAVILGLTGVTSGSINVAGGPTAYYFTNISTTAPAFYGVAQSFTAGATGPTGIFYLGSLFQDPYGPEDVGATGYISLSPTGSTRFLFNQNLGITNSFLNNNTLDEGGIVLKGSEGDKSLLWIWTDNDTGRYYDSWQSNANIGVNGDTYGIISRVYRSYGYTGINQSQFIFTAESGRNAEILLAETSTETVPLQFTSGSWKFSKQSSNNYIIGSVGSTGIGSFAENFILTPGPSGTTYPGVSVNNFAKNLNVDLLDGAHASLTSAAYTIPVAGSDGRIDANFVNSDAIRRTYTQANHGLTFGMAVRVLPNNGGFTSAVATNAEYAECVGIVSGVQSSSQFTVTHQGRIDGISGPIMKLEGGSFTAGYVYFLGASANNKGKLIEDPDYNVVTRLAVGQIKKPMLLALGATQGYVLDYVGTKLPEPTDLIYLYGIVPVGTIAPYGGSLSTLSAEWLLCDGDRYRALDYPELYNTINNTYDGRIVFTGSGTTGTMVGGSRNLQIGDSVTITPEGSVTVYEATISAVNATTGVLTFTSSVNAGAGTHRIKPNTNSSGEYLFFVPDLRARNVLGGSTGSSEYTTVGLSSHTPGDIGGESSFAIGSGTLPAHQHPVTTANISYASGGNTLTVATNVGPGGTTNLGNAISNLSPYVVTHFIIRAKAQTAVSLTIAEGHNHDGRYHFLNDNMVITADAADPYQENRPNGFKVFGATGVVSTKLETIATFFGDRTPTTGSAKTELMLRGDFSVFGNGLTTVGSGVTHTGETLQVRTHQSKVLIYGGTGSSSTLLRPSPTLEFVNGASASVPLGVIDGLTNPSSAFQATNKTYSDSSDKTIPFNGSSTNNWNARHTTTALARPSSETRILTALYDSNRNTLDSKCEVQVRGDFTVIGDGTTGSVNETGHVGNTFEVDTRTNEVKIIGTQGSASRPVPKLTFVDTPSGADVGVISGLTAPTNNNQAANKYYVDNKFSTLVFSPEILLNILTETSGINLDTAPYSNNGAAYDNIDFDNTNNYTSPASTNNLASGTWLVNVYVNAKDRGGSPGSGLGDRLVTRVKCGSATSTAQNALFFGDKLAGLTFCFVLNVTTPAPIQVEFSLSGHELFRIAVSAIRIGD